MIFVKKNATNTYRFGMYSSVMLWKIFRMYTGSVTSLAVEIVTILVSNNCCQSETAIVDHFFTANDVTDPLDIFLLRPSAYSKNCLYTPTTFYLYFFIVNCRHKVGLWLRGWFIRHYQRFNKEISWLQGF